MRYRKEWLEDVKNILAGYAEEFKDDYLWHDAYSDGLSPREAVLEYLNEG